MKILKAASLLLLAAVLTSALASGLPADAHVGQFWYFKPTKDGKQPEVFGGDPMPDKYGAVYLGDPDEKTIYLTFDAGYGCESLEKVLDTLKAQDVKATFFILPALIEYALPTVQRMIDEGHLVANHSTTHGNMALICDIDSFAKELHGVENRYREATGRELAHYFRPPEGSFTEKTLQFCKELGYVPVFWSFAYADWNVKNQPDIESSKRRVIESAHNGEVMLLHPNSTTNAAILNDVITALKERGFAFGTVDAIVKARAEGAQRSENAQP